MNAPQTEGGEEPEDGPAGRDLTAHEQEQAEERSALPAQVVHEAVRQEGEEELSRSSQALAWSGLAAGLSMGFSLVAEALLRARLPDQPWRMLVEKLGYPVGYLIVILGRQQLFTENTLTVILPLLSRRDARTLGNVLRLWALVLAANLIGVVAFTAFIYHARVFEPSVYPAMADIGREALGGGFWTIAARGVLAGWLIALIVWLMPGAETGRVAVIFVITYVVGIGGLAHVIAGSADTLYLVMAGALSWSDYAGRFLAPTLLGNAVGGVSLVALINHAQVVAGRAGQPAKSGASREAGANKRAA